MGQGREVKDVEENNLVNIMTGEAGHRNIFSVEEHFFIISSEYLDMVQTKLYGYCIIDGRIITGEAELEGKEPPLEGAFIYIKREDGKISIRQDFVGCYGLYLFREDGYWALSNSFLYLADHVKKTHQITFNKEYADHLVAVELAGGAYTKTLINEISVLDRAAVFAADINDGSFEVTLQDYRENTISLDSREGMQILDRWYCKWTNIIENVVKENYNIQCDLSGGFDSRMTFGLFLGANVNMNDVYVNSNKDGLHTHSEDYEIAKSIADYYQFELNSRKRWMGNVVNYSLEDMINMPFYCKLGFHKQLYTQNTKLSEYRYYFPGYGGEVLRGGHWIDLEEDYINHRVEVSKAYVVSGGDLSDSTRAVLERSFFEIKKKYKSFGRKIPPEDMVQFFYRETRCRIHFGSQMVENYFRDVITFCPLLDPGLNKLRLNVKECKDKDLLMAVIFERFNSGLLNFKVNGGRQIAESTRSYAQQMNKKYPIQYSAETAGRVAVKDIAPVMQEVQAVCDDGIVPPNAMRSLIKNVFYSSKTKQIFEMLYSPMLYQKLAGIVEKAKYHSESNAVVVIAISKLYQDCCVSGYMNGLRYASDYLKKLLKNKTEESLCSHPYLQNYITARIDIKNRKSIDNTIEVLEISDPSAVIRTPEWFKSDGQGTGYVIHSNKGRLSIKFKCIGNGDLQITLRGKEVKDSGGRRIPFWIDYTSMQINEDRIFNETICVWHNAPCVARRNVKDGEIILVFVAWCPHDERKHKCFRL